MFEKSVSGEDTGVVDESALMHSPPAMLSLH